MAANQWLNNDGLLIKFGTSEAKQGALGTVAGFGEGANVGDLQAIEIRIPDMTLITTTAQPIDDNYYLPKGARIEKVETIADTAATSGGSATLTVGLMKSDRSTLIDATGVLSAAPLADHNTLGTLKQYQVGTAGAGSQIGTASATTFPALITAKYTTAVYTGGALTIRVWVKFP
jgi:hypothetical protein